ncbi:MAG: hypothetical protein K0R34_3605 [Herbinix sp.]|jgi:hypothetical protein|nr:hypothetical protein [Herbinix sp.]
MSEHPKVFISYSHQNAEYENKILEFANHLRSEGIDANIDLYEEAPADGWPRWMENQINNSNYVLIVSSKSFYEKCYSESNKSKGISWEVNIVYQHIYVASTINTKFIPVYFDKDEEQYILTPLKSFTFYNVGEKEGFDKLYWRLRGISLTQKPPLGALRPLPPKEQRTMFFSTPINLEKWNAAKWRGMLYLFSPGYAPVLGLLYHNYSAAKDIFTDWKLDCKDNFADEFIKVDYITPPFPKNCWVYTDKERNYGRGYFVHIGPNTEESFNRAIASGLCLEEIFIASVSRYQWMDELKGSQNRDSFQYLTGNGSGYFLMPIGIKDITKPFEESNLIIDFNYAIQMKNITFKTGIDIEDNDICKVVLNKAEELTQS